MKSKKAQIAGQIFVFILAAVLAILIITYGYKAISSFLGRAEQIELVSFEKKMEKEIKTIASDFGSVKKLELNMPGNYRKFCIIDLSENGKEHCVCDKNKCDGDEEDYSPIICDAWKDPAYPNPDNAFLIPVTPLQLPRVEVEGGYVCFESNSFSLRLEGMGNRTKVSGWPR